MGGKDGKWSEGKMGEAERGEREGTWIGIKNKRFFKKEKKNKLRQPKTTTPAL